MANNRDGIQIKVSVPGAEEVERKLKDVAAAEEHVGKQAVDSGRQADEASRGHSRFRRAIDGVGSSIRGLTTSWLGLAALTGAILAFFRELASAAAASAQAIADIGRGMRGLAVNVGGERADTLLGEINAIARDSKFDTEGRAQLVEAATALTDFRPDATNDQIVASLKNLAMLQRATGVGGQEGFRTVNSLQANLGLAEDESVDVATTLLNSGFEAQTVQQLAERGGNVGGLDFMSLILAARGKGLNVAQSGEQIETLIGSLTRRGADGGLAPELAGLGVTGNMTLNQRLAFLVQARDSGQISRGQFETAIGGAQNLKIVSPLARALTDPAAMTSARAQLGDDQAVENAIAALLESEAIQAEERANARDLQNQIATEESGMGGIGETIDEVNTTVKDAGGGSWWLGLFSSSRDLAEASVRTQYNKGLRSTRMSDEEAAEVLGMSVEEYRANTRPVGYSKTRGSASNQNVPDGQSRRMGSDAGATPDAALSSGTVINDYRTQYLGVQDAATVVSDRASMFS